MALSEFNRRSLVKSLVCALCVAGLGGCRPKSGTAARKGKVRLGQAGSLKSGINLFSIERLAVIKENTELRAISLVCTHQNCLIRLNDSSQTGRYVCACHGSRFDEQGRVLNGPASSDLPFYKILLNSQGELEVDFSQVVDSRWSLVLSD